MKNKLISCVVAFLLITSCEKEKSKDFRDKYVGKYQVVEKFNSYGPVNTCGDFFSIKDTSIYVGYGNSDSTLTVLDREVKLDSAGWYRDYHYTLRLWNDSISSWHQNGGLGCGIWESYVGYKIK